MKIYLKITLICVLIGALFTNCAGPERVTFSFGLPYYYSPIAYYGPYSRPIYCHYNHTQRYYFRRR